MKKAAFKTVGLIGKLTDPAIGTALSTLSNFLLKKGLQVILDEGSAHMLPDAGLQIGTRAAIGEQCDLAIVLGGDGTLLNAARTLADFDVPLAGVNLGRLGFLTDISADTMLERLDEILQGQYSLEERFLLHCTITREGNLIGEGDAFNDIVIHKWNVARMIELETYVNGLFVNLQRSDGMIVSTPTGSTAYALSAGGPILYPTLNAIVIVPVSPHTLSNRPIVVDGDSHIEVVICESNHDSTQVTCDGQITFGLAAGDRIHIRKKERSVQLVHPPKHNQFEILRAKLRWAENPK